MKTRLILLISFLSLKIGFCQSEKLSSASTKFKVLSWNIYMLPGLVTGKGKKDRAEAIGEILKKSDYDAIVFQEAFHGRSRKTIYQLLKDQYPYQAGPANQKLISFRTNSGIWIFSKHPITSSRSIIFKNRSGIDAFSRKGALLAELSIDQRRIQIAGTHLQNSGPAWIKQAQCIEFYHRVLKPEFREGVPQIICGDLNIEQSNTEEYRSMLQNLDAKNTGLSSGFSFSYDRGRNDLHVENGTKADLIDYILLRHRNEVEEMKIKIIPIRKKWCARHEDLSDHFALEAEMLIKDQDAIFSSLQK